MATTRGGDHSTQRPQLLGHVQMRTCQRFDICVKPTSVPHVHACCPGMLISTATKCIDFKMAQVLGREAMNFFVTSHFRIGFYIR